MFTGLHSDAEVRLTEIETGNLQLKDKVIVGTDGWCDTVQFNYDGRLLVGTLSGRIQVRSLENHSTTQAVIPTGKICYEIKALADKVYVLVWAGENSHIVGTIDLDSEKATGLFKFESEYSRYMTLTENYIFVIEWIGDTRNIKVYNQHTKCINDYKLPDRVKFPEGLVALSDDCLLVTDYKSGSVFKYKLKESYDKRLIPEWEIQGLYEPRAICGFQDGFVLVCSEGGQKLYLITEDGELA